MVSAIAQTSDPPKEIADLSWMVGTWSGTGKNVYDGKETPFTTSMTVSRYGQTIQAVSTLTPPNGVELILTRMIGWDAVKRQYVSYTFSNMAGLPLISRGTLTNNKLVMLFDKWGTDTTKVGRETMSKISDTKYGFRTEMRHDKKWEVQMDMVLQKI